MTFIPSVLSKQDNNNSTTSTSDFTGTSTDITGYTNLIITIKSDQNSSAGGIMVLFHQITQLLQHITQIHILRIQPIIEHLR